MQPRSKSRRKIKIMELLINQRLPAKVLRSLSSAPPTSLDSPAKIELPKPVSKTSFPHNSSSLGRQRLSPRCETTLITNKSIVFLTKNKREMTQGSRTCWRLVVDFKDINSFYLLENPSRIMRWLCFPKENSSWIRRRLAAEKEVPSKISIKSHPFRLEITVKRALRSNLTPAW